MTRFLLDQLHQWLHNKPTVFDLVFWAGRFEWEWEDIEAAAGILIAGMVANATARVLVIVAIVGYRRCRRLRHGPRGLENYGAVPATDP